MAITNIMNQLQQGGTLCKGLSPVGSATSTRICYHCKQVGHVKAQCPLLAARLVQAQATSTLRLIDERQGRVELPRAQGRDFQLTI